MNSTPQIPVAVFLTAFVPGGTERQMTELIRRLDARRFKVHVACFRREGDWLPRVLERAPVTGFPIRGFGRPATILQLMRFARWCRRHRIAVVQGCDLYANSFALPGAWLAGVPVRIGSRRELNPDKSNAQIRLQRLAYRAATRVVGNSPAALQILEAEGVARAKTTLIPNGVEAAAYAGRQPRQSVSRIITVANLRPEKSHEVLIAAAQSLRASCPGLRYRLVGAGSRRAELEALAQARGVADIIEFLGHRDDVPALLKESDLFVLPSRSEAFPNGAIEAMATGLPVIASAVGGLLDLVESGRTGLLIQPGDPEQLAATIRGLVEDPARAAAIGAEARREIASRYSFDRMVGAFEDLYESELMKHTEAALGGSQRVAGRA